MNLDVEVLDLLQLHCPPTQVYYMPEVFGALDDLVQAGKLRYYGVSVEKVEEALKPSNTRVCSRSKLFSICFVSDRLTCSSGKRCAGMWEY